VSAGHTADRAVLAVAKDERLETIALPEQH